MNQWFQSSLGQSIVDNEVVKCSKLIPSGYYANSLQVGLPWVNYARGHEISNRFVVDTAYAGAKAGSIDMQTAAGLVIANSEALPFPERSQDLVILPHTLDYSTQPHEVLRQVNQILSPEGCLVITGFNLISFYGAIKLVKSRSANMPWNGHFYSVVRVQDWLGLLDYDLVGAGMMSYQPPIQSEKWRGKLSFIEKAGDRWWPGMAGVYVIVARKREMSVTPLPKPTRIWRQLIPGMAQPASQRAAKMGIRLVTKN